MFQITLKNFTEVILPGKIFIQQMVGIFPFASKGSSLGIQLIIVPHNIFKIRFNETEEILNIESSKNCYQGSLLGKRQVAIPRLDKVVIGFGQAHFKGDHCSFNPLCLGAVTNNMAVYFILLRLLMPFLKIELAMLFFYNGLVFAPVSKWLKLICIMPIMSASIQ